MLRVCQARNRGLFIYVSYGYKEVFSVDYVFGYLCVGCRVLPDPQKVKPVGRLAGWPVGPLAREDCF